MKKFNLNSRNARWYKFFWLNAGRWGHTMPEDTCTYYRNTIFSYLLFPFTFIGLLISYLFPKLRIDRPIDRFFTNILLVGIPIILGSTFKYTSNPFIWWGIGVLLMLGVVISAIIVAIFCFSVQYLIRKLRTKKKQTLSSYKPKKESIVVSWYKQLRDKTCQKIKWE